MLRLVKGSGEAANEHFPRKHPRGLIENVSGAHRHRDPRGPDHVAKTGKCSPAGVSPFHKEVGVPLDFFRVDSDFPALLARQLSELARPREADYCFKLWLLFYAELATHVVPNPEEKLTVDLEKLAEKMPSRLDRVQRNLPILARALSLMNPNRPPSESKQTPFCDQSFELVVSKPVTKTVEVRYPNFWRLQAVGLQNPSCKARQNGVLPPIGRMKSMQEKTRYRNSFGNPQGSRQLPVDKSGRRRQYHFGAMHLHIARSMIDQVRTNPRAERIGYANESVWANEIRLLLERDGVLPAHLITILEWVFHDDFWRFQIQSAHGLRANWKKLVSDYNKKMGPGSFAGLQPIIEVTQ